MLQEIRDMGFEYAELSHGIRISLLPGILEAVDAGVIRISSLHNFCPLPIGYSHAAPNIYKFTSLDSRERENAVRHTLRTIEVAERVKASLVVLHYGSVRMDDYTDRLADLLELGEKDSPKYEKLCAELRQTLERRKAPHIEAAREPMDRIARAAEASGIKLGVENREALEELPIDNEIEALLEQVNRPIVGYWHDTGHAQIKDNLGFINHVGHLEGLASRLHGFHIHDVRFPAMDHCPPGTGMIDFAALRHCVAPDHIRVLELNPAVPAPEVLRGLQYIQKAWGT
jgi:sugar phosphate isomerase/epimerase